jgi:general secretion pathway protein A
VEPELAWLLQDAAAATGLDGAWSRLFGLWGAHYVAGSEAACSQALRQGLECLEETGGLEALRRYNRPAILSLEDGTGAMHQTVLAQLLDGERARLMIGEDAWELPLAEIGQRWNGIFLLLWKPPQLDTRNLSVGAWGEPVRNLRTRLNAWAGIVDAGTFEPDYFDEELRELVMRFQAHHGISVDGIAGVRTQALLDSAVAGEGTPLLSVAAR